MPTTKVMGGRKYKRVDYAHDKEAIDRVETRWKKKGYYTKVKRVNTFEHGLVYQLWVAKKGR